MTSEYFYTSRKYCKVIAVVAVRKESGVSYV